MNFIDKLRLIRDFDSIFTIKVGKFVHHKNKCYKVPKVLTTIFKIYYYGGIAPMLLLFIFLGSPHIFDNLILQFFQSILIYILLEIVLFTILPLRAIPCWEENIKYK